jgi:hypothetical protein
MEGKGMTMHHWAGLAILACMFAAGGLTGGLLARHVYERQDGRMDDAYQQGASVCQESRRWLDGVAETAEPPSGPPPSPAAEDFLHPDWEQLAPGRIQDDPPVLPGGSPAATMALHPEWGMHDMPLPAVLHLGAEFDGGPQTVARVDLRLWDMTTRFEAAQERHRVECGLPAARGAWCAA